MVNFGSRRVRTHLAEHDVVDDAGVVGDVHVPAALRGLGPVVLDHAGPRDDEARGVEVHEVPLKVGPELASRHVVDQREDADEEQRARDYPRESDWKQHQVSQDDAYAPQGKEVEVPVPRRVIGECEARVEGVVDDRRRRVLEHPRRVEQAR